MRAAVVLAAVPCPKCGQPVGVPCRPFGGVCVQRAARAEMTTMGVRPGASPFARWRRERWRQARYG